MCVYVWSFVACPGHFSRESLVCVCSFVARCSSFDLGEGGGQGCSFVACCDTGPLPICPRILCNSGKEPCMILAYR